MIYIFIFFILCCEYYSSTYGVYLWTKEHNKLGGAAMILLAVLGAVIPVVVMYIKA